MTPSIHFVRGLQRFEITKDREKSVWVGYLNGRQAVTAEEPYLAARALLQRYAPDRGASTPTS